MQIDQLKAILNDALLLIEKNKALVTPDLLDQIEKLIPLFKGMNASTIQAAAMACGIRTDVNLGQIISIVQTIIDQERVILSGTGDSLATSIKKLLDHPIELQLLSKFL